MTFDASCPTVVVHELLAGAKTEEEIVGPGGLLSQLTKRLVERALEVELKAIRRLDTESNLAGVGRRT